MNASLPPEAYAAALAAVPPLGPARLERLLRRWSPADAWAALREGKASTVWGEGEPAWRVAKDRPGIDHIGRQGRARSGCGLGARPQVSRSTCSAAPAYPVLLAADLAPPSVLFTRGHLEVLDDARRVTIVGTRNATAAGREVAAELGRDLAREGVVVVSGLARGIDGWAHRGRAASRGRGATCRRGGERPRRRLPARAPPALGRGRRPRASS